MAILKLVFQPMIRLLKQTGCGQETVGVDKGYSEAFVDSDGDVYGSGLGKLISSESDYLNKTSTETSSERLLKLNHTKKQKIELNNLGRKTR